MTEVLPEADTVRLKLDGEVASLTLYRPKKRNAINWHMWQELLAALDSVESSSARVLTIRGSDGAFCSGADLSAEAPDLHPLRQMELINRVIVRLHRLTKLTMAVVDGDAVGVGCNLALACDFVVASVRSRFSEIFVRRGMSVDGGGSWILPRLIGLHAAKELCLAGDFVSGAEAKAMGLISRCEDGDRLEAAVEELIGKLLLGAPIAQTLTKRLLAEGTNSTLEAALDAEAAAQLVNLAGTDAAEARRAFMDRREARFAGDWGPPR